MDVENSASPVDASGATDLNAVTVTAFRREQELHDVPAAVSVLTAESIRGQGAQDIRDYLTTVPGVNFTEGNTGAMQVTIRGIGGFGSNPLAGIYLDETPITESYFATLDPDVFDIDRVEVLRGPQGTLYGSSSMGGTVRIITRRPELDWFESSLETTIGSIAGGGLTRRVDGVVNIPVAEERVALRVSAGYRNDDGWVDNAYNGQRNVNDIEKKNVRAQLLVQPTESTSIVLGAMKQDEERGLANLQDPALGDFRISRSFGSYGESEANLFNLTAEHDFGWGSITSATSIMDKSGADAADAGFSIRGVVNSLLGVDMGADEGVGLHSGTDFELKTQEVRLASSGDGRFDYVVGGFYSDAKTNVLQIFDFTQAPTVAAVQTGADFYTWAQSYDTRQKAVFGEATFHATERVSLTAGLRAFEFEQSSRTSASGTLNGGASESEGRVSNSSTQQKYLVEFKATQDNLAYLQASQGYRNGGPTGDFPYAACADALEELGYTTVPKSYGPDKLWNYELGSKNRFADGRVTVNGAVYQVDWTDIQLDATLGCGFGLTINAGKAVSRGFELETVFEPIPRLTLSGSVSYNDARLERSAPGVRAQDGDPVPNASDWSWTAGAQYRFELPDGINLFVRADVNHVGERWNTVRSYGPAAVLLGSYTIANARVGIMRDGWSAALFATNLFDEDVVTGRTTGGIPVETVGRPRTVGVTARFDF